MSRLAPQSQTDTKHEPEWTISRPVTSLSLILQPLAASRSMPFSLGIGHARGAHPLYRRAILAS